MLHKTRGIVFRFTRFRESSIIVTIFTEHFGLQSYIVNSVRSTSSKGKMALFQPLTLLNLVVYHKENANLLRIKEATCHYPYQSIQAEVKKSSIALFVNEVVNKTVKDQSHTDALFGFISSSLIMLDKMPSGFENFHLVFLIKLSRLLGFGAHAPAEILGGRVVAGNVHGLLRNLLDSSYEVSVQMTVVQRRELLDLLLGFYKSHIDTLGDLKSVPVLREVLG